MRTRVDNFFVLILNLDIQKLTRHESLIVVWEILYHFNPIRGYFYD